MRTDISFKSFLEERFETREGADDAYRKLMPLLDEAVEEVRIETRPVIESADTPNQEKNTAEEVPA